MRNLVLGLLAILPSTAFAWPVQLHGDLVATAPVAIPATVDMILYANGFGQAVITVAGMQEQAPARWTLIPGGGGVAIAFDGSPFIYGIPSRGCLTGQVTRPMPPMLQPLLGQGQITYRWDVCAVP